MLGAILYGGLIAGVLAITDALVFFGLRGSPPMRLLQNIASGLVGPKAFDGGWPMAALGLALHFTIAMGAAVVYNMAARWIPVMTQSPWWCGPVYGLLVFAFMNLVVLPLAFGRFRPMSLPVAANLAFAPIFCAGLPIANLTAAHPSALQNRRWVP